ncbi:DUF3619 family protein [Marilutibacter alkalisoli]|uniref:DUF3619 family protein n=1 Tax=Marilutibacter alkalisoli TaxID=2591633 RepID=A0A514BTM4_9GAMM|nr:DUF3619 family protein [Lysobacter alkalisoli]QDH70740.1 DUF3619 family protein [Lysobacter alkalisoli]
MTANHDNETRFDAAMRQLHRASLEQLPPATAARLRSARRDALASPRPRHGLGWSMASATAAVFALAIGVFWLRPDAPAPSPDVAITAPGGDNAIADVLLAAEIEALVATYDEDPDLYLWLAVNDDALPPILER